MCNKCANLENRLPYERILAIRETDRYRGSKEHKEDMARLEEMFKQVEAKEIADAAEDANQKS